jgi:N6-L-threonylcarbamoyladenine synthase
LGFPYPGGAKIDQHANYGNPKAFDFAKPVIQGSDFSFSGLKTSILYFLQKNSAINSNFISENLNDLCASIQQTIIEILIKKIKTCAKDLNINQIAIAGGVSANSGLRIALLDVGRENHWEVFIPKFEYCTDNAAMIAITGRYLFDNKQFVDQSVSAQARLPLPKK